MKHMSKGGFTLVRMVIILAIIIIIASVIAFTSPGAFSGPENDMFCGVEGTGAYDDAG